MNSLLFYVGKRPNNSKELIKKELKLYLKEELIKGKSPSKRELEHKFHLKLDCPIVDLYVSAGLIYKLSPNQNLKSLKANLLLEIILSNLTKLNLRLIKYRGVRERGIDIVAEQDNVRVGVELKAYNKYEMLKIKDIRQVERSIKQENLNKAIIITTTDKFDKKIYSNKSIKIILCADLLNLLKSKDIARLSFIQNESVNQENPIREIKRQKILKYVFDKYVFENKKPSYIEILKDLHLDVYTYFKNLFEIYELLKIPPPLWRMGGKRAPKPNIERINIWKDEFKKYIWDEIKRGHKYPSGEDIGKHFKISHIWNIVNMSELYKELNLDSYLERKKRFTFAPKS